MKQIFLWLAIASTLHAQTPSGISNYTQALIRQALRESHAQSNPPVSSPKAVLTPSNAVLASGATNAPANSPAAPMGRKETLMRIWDEAINNGWQSALRPFSHVLPGPATNAPPAPPTNAPAPAPPAPASTNGGLVLCLPFEEGQGSVTHDQSGYGVAGEATDPKLPVLWTNGIAGHAISTANTNLFRIPHAPHLSGLRQITVSCWINGVSAPGSAHVWVSKHGGGGHGEFFLAGLTTNTIRWTVINSSGNRANVDNRCPRWTDGKWHHIAGTYDGKVMRLYFDGAQVGSGNLTGPLNSYEAPILIGDYDWKPFRYPSFHFSGLMDEVKIWNRALTAEEVKQGWQKR